MNLIQFQNTKEHIDSFIKLHREVFNSDLNETFVKNKYFPNNEKEAYGYFAFVNEVCLGFYGVILFKYSFDNIEYDVAQSCDTMVSKLAFSYRISGIFDTLAKATYKMLFINKINIVFGFPSISSQKGFFQRLNWERIDNSYLYFIPNPFYFIDRRKSIKRKLINTNERIYSNYSTLNSGIKKDYRNLIELKEIKIFNKKILVRDGVYLDIGEVEKTTSVKKILILLGLMYYMVRYKFKGIRTYCTSNSSSSLFFNRYFFKKQSLPLGVLFINGEKIGISFCFNFIDYDTF